MPITTSAQKALRQNKRRRTRNIATKKQLKLAVKKFTKLLATDKKAAAAELSNVYKQLDKAAKVGVLKKNTASRLKSRLSKRVGR